MRKFLFRGKRINGDGWVEGGIDSNEDGNVFISRKRRYFPDTRDWDTADWYEKNPHYARSFYHVIPETVGQYIGLLDDKGKKIFEGDIVQTKQGRRYVVVWVSTYTYSGWDLKPISPTFCGCMKPEPLNIYKSDNLSVVGNIHDQVEAE